jgi:RNA ligase
MDSMKDLQELVVSGFDDWQENPNVRAIRKDGLILFNYTHAAHAEGRWTWFELASRGLILDSETGEVVARPFDKFFNWNERGRKSSGHIVTVTEKLDGSLGILYRQGGEHKVATRGSFDGEQAAWATEFLAKNHDLSWLPDDYTLLFEIIYPENRIVVDYGDTEALYLLGIRNRFTGDYMPFYPRVYTLGTRYGFPVPQVYSFNNVRDLIEATGALPATAEGWVVEFSDGQRFKFKGDEYVEIHRLVTNATFRRVLSSVANGTYDVMVSNVPDEFLTQVKAWRDEIEETIVDLIRETAIAFAIAPKSTRKEFALWAKAHYPELMPYLFAVLDRKEIRPLILKKAFKDR